MLFTPETYQFSEPDPEPGAATGSALSLQVTEELLTLDGYVGPLDRDADVYRVEVPADGRLAAQIEHIGKTGTVSAALAMDEAIPDFKAPIATFGGGPGLYSLPDAKRPPSGTYLLQVTGSGPYRLGVALDTSD